MYKLTVIGCDEECDDVLRLDIDVDADKTISNFLDDLRSSAVFRAYMANTYDKSEFKMPCLDGQALLPHVRLSDLNCENLRRQIALKISKVLTADDLRDAREPGSILVTTTENPLTIFEEEGPIFSEDVCEAYDNDKLSNQTSLIFSRMAAPYKGKDAVEKAFTNPFEATETLKVRG